MGLALSTWLCFPGVSCTTRLITLWFPAQQVQCLIGGGGSRVRTEGWLRQVPGRFRAEAELLGLPLLALEGSANLWCVLCKAQSCLDGSP